MADLSENEISLLKKLSVANFGEPEIDPDKEIELMIENLIDKGYLQQSGEVVEWCSKIKDMVPASYVYLTLKGKDFLDSLPQADA